MMELTCAFILLSASLVIASPHGYGGYGVKGGASARAEASASAGAFGGVPIPVPLGVGYSGSFSKSSSSSSASSSASSSSSSSSFSFGGSGAGGLALESGGPNHGGCSAGNCHTARGGGVPTPLGSSPEGYNSANAAASAEAGAVSGVGCQGLSCGGNSDKCKSGQCKPHTETTSINSDPNKCALGQCGSALEKGATPTDYGSNDIRVSYSSGSAHNAKDQLSGIENTSPAYNTVGSDCSHGKCGPSGSLNSKPNDYGHDFQNTYKGSSASNKQQASSADTGIITQYQKPSPHLETPKLGSNCNTGNCYSEPAKSGHENSPSSYNVPIHGAYEKGNPKPSCDGVKCENQPKGPYSPTYNTGNKGPLSSEYPSSMNCAGSGCLGIPSNQATSRPSHTVGPSNVQFGPSPSNTPTDTATSCNSPNCTPFPTNPVGSNIAPGHIEHGKPTDVNKPSNDNLPAYTGGFGGPAGLLNPNEYNFSAPTGKPSHYPTSAHNGKPLEGSPTGCNSPSCSGYPSTSRPTGGSVSEATYNLRPGGDIPSEKLPTYTGGFGGPAGMLKPNEFDIHGTVANKPNYAHAGSPSSNTQLPVGNTGALNCKVGENCGGYTPTAGPLPAGNTGALGCKVGESCGGYTPTVGQLPAGNTGALGCKVGENCGGYTPTTGQLPAGNTGALGCKVGENCDGYTPTAGTSFGATAPSGYYGTTKPHTDINSNNGFDGSGVIFNHEKHYTHSTGPSSPGYTPSEPFNTPTSSGHPTGCKTPNCYSSFGSTVAPNAPAEAFGVTKPSSGSHLPSVTLPAYTNNHDRPSGVYRPSDISGPVLNPSLTHIQSPSLPGSYSTGCKTGNCANYPTSGQPGVFGVTKPNTNVNTAPSHSQYTGGPSGTFKPTEHTYVTPSKGSVPTNCGTPNCIGSPSASADATSGINAQSGSYGITKPNDEHNVSNEKPIYTGGFGGAAGLLKPNEYTVSAVSPKPNNKPTRVPAAVGTPACTSGHCDTQPPHGIPLHIDNASSGAHATAVAAATADAVVYSGGFGGPPGVLTPYDDGKIGALPTNGAQAHVPQIGGAHGAHNANGHLQHGKIPVANGGPSGSSGVHENIDAQAGSLAGATAYAGAAAGASAGAHGYNPHGSHYNYEGNIKGGSPCGGGCGGNPSGAAAKSLAGANAFGVGGSYASSSTSAHASAGAYTKGGYGKR